MKRDINPPTDDIPRIADMAELCRPRASVAIGGGEAGAAYLAGSVLEDDVARGYCTKEIVKPVARAVALAFG